MVRKKSLAKKMDLVEKKTFPQTYLLLPGFESSNLFLEKLHDKQSRKKH